MDNISLEEEEYIIASDNASLAREFFPKSGTLMLTNVRILFLSSSKWGPPVSVSIDLDKIDLIDHKHWLRHSFHIHAEDNKYRFFGKGGHRIYERLLLRRKALSIGNIQGEENIQAFREIIYIQGDIQVFITGQLTAHAQIFFTSKKLRVDAYYSFLKRYPPFECTLEEVSSFSYNLLNKSLDIQTHEQTISIMGDLIPKLYLLLIAQKEGGVSQTWNAKGITFNRGILFIKGIASLSHKHFLFCPTGSVDSFAGAQEIHIPIKDVHRIDLRGWPERNITLSYGDQTFSFSTPNIKRDFRSLAFNIVQFKPNTPWKVSKKEELLAINKTWSLQLKEGMEKIILINWTAFEFSEECFLFGWLMLTNLRVIFLSLEHTQKWSAQVLNIEAPNNQRSGINISYQNKLHFFLCFGGVRFSKLFWNKIAMIKPPPEISSARSGQSVDKIIGPSRQALVYKNQYPIHKLTGIKVIKRSQSILIQCDKLPATELTEGSIIEVEIPKEVGRFRFYTTVKEVHLVRPTPMRVYMLSVALPDNIYVYNQRKAFRVPFQQEVTIDLCRIEKPIRYYLTDELEIETSLEAEIFDLSFEGVGLLLPNSLQDESPKTLMIRFSFSLFDQNVQVQGTIRHVGYLAEQEKWSHGIHFVNLPPQTEQKIFQEVLKLERELLRSAEEDQ